jgi:hypothetical protein
LVVEVLLHFEGSRRVLNIGEGSTIEVELEKELVERFPGRDLTVAPIGQAVPQSPSKDVYMLQKLTLKWGYVDVTDRSQVQGGDEVTLVKVSKLEKVRLFCKHVPPINLYSPPG